MTPEKLEEMAKQAGREIPWQPLDELASLVVEGVREGRYIIMKGIEDAAGTLRTRADAFGEARLPKPAGHLG
jgi:hypothetical protein